MALGTFVAGRYSATYDPVGATAATDLGITEGGYQIGIRHAKEMIRETDQYGETVIDAIYRGISDVTVNFLCVEYKAGPLLAALPYAVLAPTGNVFLGTGLIGRLDTDVAGALVLTDTDSTPAATKPATLTTTYAIIAEGHEVQMALTSKLRKLPLRLRIYPYDDTGVTKYWAST